MWKWMLCLGLVGCASVATPVVPKTESRAARVFHPHPFWHKEAFPTLPDTIERSRYGVGPSWAASLPMDATLELWPGGIRVKTCAIEGVRVLEKQGDVLTYEIEEALRFEPKGSLRELTRKVTMVSTFLHDAQGHPFARIPKGWQLKEYEGDKKGHVCVDAPACQITGRIEPGALGPMTYHSGLQVLDRPDAMHSIYFTSKPQTVTLFGAKKQRLFDVQAAAINVLSRGPKWSEVLVRARVQHDGKAHSLDMYGFLPVDVERGLKTPKMEFGDALDHLLERKTNLASQKWRYVMRGRWVHGAPAKSARFAQVRALHSRFRVRQTPEDAPGWTAIWVRTPWGDKPGYVLDSLSQSTRPPGTSTLAHRVYSDSCRHRSNDDDIPF